MKTRIARHGGLGVLVLLLFSAVAYGSTYYVRTDGNDSNTGTTNTSSGAWRTIGWAAGHVNAGDTVRVQGGTYIERVTPSRNGSAGSLISFVTDGTVSMCGFDFSSNNYIRVIGFAMNGAATGCPATTGIVNLSGTNAYVEFWNNDM